MTVTKPIFIVGVGRSGSTIFHRIFTRHPDVTWLSSRLGNKFPERLWTSRALMRAIDYPLIGEFLRRRFRTGEAYPFWEHYCPGFSDPTRDLVAGDVTTRLKSKIPSVLSQMLTPKRHRALIKITGWPRIGFLHEIFPDAKFIHIQRDGRAVINSMINVDWWWGWRGPQNWRFGELSPEHQAEWEHFDRSFLALAGIELEILEEAKEKARRLIPANQFMEIEYEDLCNDGLGIFRQVVDFCELPWSSSFEASIKSGGLRSANYKWKEDLTEEQQQIVEHFAKKVEKKPARSG